MHVIRPSEYRVMPWKNGGGVTTELYVSSRAQNFDWRVSIATVNEDGPFSPFNGYERHIMVLSESGMSLNISRRGRFDLKPLVPFTFSGEAEVKGILSGGPVQDFNLMVRREFGRGTLRVVDCRAGDKIGSDRSLHFLYVVQGECGVENDRLHPKDSFWLEKGERISLTTSAKLAICEVTPR